MSEHFGGVSQATFCSKLPSKQTAVAKEHAASPELRTSKDAFNQGARWNETLGVVHRELTMYKNEQARLQQVMHHERAEIQQCVDEGNELREGKPRQARLLQSMGALNKDLADLLMQQDIRLQKMVSVESAQFALVLWPRLRQSSRRNAMTCLTKQAGAQALGISMLLSAISCRPVTTQDEVSRQKGLEE
jgi:hypothetical protein